MVTGGAVDVGNCDGGDGTLNSNVEDTESALTSKGVLVVVSHGS